MTTRKAILGGAVLAVGLLGSGEALASGYSVARFGAEHGHPTTTNPTAIYYNPAGIGFSEGTHLFVNGDFAWRRVTYERPDSDTPVPAGADGGNSGKNSLFNVIASPMLGVTHSFGDLAIGAAFFTPFGGSSYWNKADEFDGNTQYPGLVDGSQRWYSIDGELRSSFIALSAAGKIMDSLSVGVAFNIITSTVNTLRARTLTGDDNIDQEGRSWLEASGWDWSFGIGAMYEISEDTTWVGASFQSGPNPFGSNEMALSGELRTPLPTTYSDEANAVDFHTDLPEVVRLGFRHRPADDLELRVFGDYQTWSTLEEHCLGNEGKPCEVNADGSDATPDRTVIQNQRRRWNDTFGVRVGASKWISEPVELFAGAGYGSNAVPDEYLEPALLDMHSITLTLGGRFELSEDSVYLATSYTQVFYVPREVEEGTSTHDDLVQPSRSPSGDGKYNQMVGVLNANLEFVF